MARGARIKSPEAIFHIMVRSISEILLFRNDDDKNVYLNLISKYQKVFLFKVHGYCLMSNHAHLIVDCCGADISKIMKSISQCYAMYYNSKYKRHGHLFQDRFKSKIVTSNSYLIALSIYIHNNPKDIADYKSCIEKYAYSSLGVFLGIQADKYNIIDTSFILNLCDNNKLAAIKRYSSMMKLYDNPYNLQNVKFDTLPTDYSRNKNMNICNYQPNDIVRIISQLTGSYFDVRLKYIRQNTEVKSICAVVLHSLCNYRHKDICGFFGNTSESSISRLCKHGFNLMATNSKYTDIVSKILSYSENA